MSADYLCGRVIDASDGEPLPDVSVNCRASGYRWSIGKDLTSNSLGYFFVDYGDYVDETMRLEMRFEYTQYELGKEEVIFLAHNQ